MLTENIPKNTQNIQKKVFNLKLIFIFVSVLISIILGTILNFYLKKIMIFDAINILSILIIGLLLALFLKINYSKPVFVFDLFIAVFLVSFYPFGQGLLIFLILILSQKLAKIFS